MTMSTTDHKPFMAPLKKSRTATKRKPVAAKKAARKPAAKKTAAVKAKKKPASRKRS